MQLRHLGYACINLSLNRTTNKTLRLSTLTEYKIMELIKYNLDSLLKVLQWNLAYQIYFFRVSSEVIPLASHQAFTWDWQAAFEGKLQLIKKFVQENNIRLSMHPGQYTVLNSPKKEVVETALQDIEYHARFIQEVDPANGTVVVHVGGKYENKEQSLRRFKENYQRLSALAKDKLVLENDDKVFNLDDVLEVCEAVQIPMVFDIFHHKCNHIGENWGDNLIPRLERAMATWVGKIPKVHISSQKAGTKTSHADYISPEDYTDLLEVMGQLNEEKCYDLMVEAKKKDLALFQLRNLQ